METFFKGNKILKTKKKINQLLQNSFVGKRKFCFF